MGSVADYQDQLLLLLARCDNVSEHQQVDLFTTGLRNPLHMDVEMQRPETLEDAMGLARTMKGIYLMELDDSAPVDDATRSPTKSWASP